MVPIMKILRRHVALLVQFNESGHAVHKLS